MLFAKKYTLPLAIAAVMAAASPAAAQNPVSAVTMASPSLFYYRNNLSFTFTMATDMPSSMETVTLLLMNGDSETSCALLRYPFRVPASPGANTVSLRTPTCAAPGNAYKVRVIATATQSRDSGSFEIAQSNEACGAGEFNANGGSEPGCIACPIGAYSTTTGQSDCTNCTDGMTTSFRGATNSDACNVTVVPAEQGYLKFDKSYFYHSNAGGTLLMAHEHKTIEECQRACTMSPGCKAFDAGGVEGTMAFGGAPQPGNGNQEIFQAGDCFMSYDTIGTIKAGDVGMTNQLELFQKVEAQKVKEIFFRKTSDCYIHESNDGGSYKDEHSPEACAQLCLNDKSCVSFDAGAVVAGTNGQRWQPAIDDCFLSYKNRSAVDSADFVCNSDAGLDYFERIIPKYLEINMEFDSIGGWDKVFRDEAPNLPEWRTWSTGEAAYFNNRFNCTPQPACHRNFIRPRKTCPVTWDYDQIVAPLYPFIGTRDNYATAVAEAVAGVLGVAASDIAVRVEASTVADGVAGSSPARTTAVINVGTSQNDNRFSQRFRIGRDLTIAGQSYSVQMRTAVRCAAGHTSQSGYTPGCMQCPPDSYANWPQTDCIECPLGTISDAGSSTTGEKACRPQEDTSIAALGPFRVGYEWFGVYQTPLGVDGNGRMGRGQMKLRITQASISGDNFIEIEAYASVRHGEDCGTNCRDPGISEFFMSGYVEGTSVSLSPGGWGGITDRNTRLFTRGDINAEVATRDRNTLMTGTMYGDGQEGSITLYERCHSADETSTFQPGNKFLGTYSCYRRGTDMNSPGFGNDPCQSASEGNLPEQDIRRIEILVTNLDEESGVIQASINFDHADGEAEYHVSGTYDADSGAITFDASAGAWNSPHPGRIPARQISGRLSDDKEWFQGQFNANPNCRCNGTSSGGEGGECGGEWTILGNVNDPWCFVGADCPDGSAFPGMMDTYYGHCNIDRTDYSSLDNFFETCTDVTLARVCSTSAPNCPAGWASDPIQDRCMRLSTSFADPTPLNFGDAQAFCADQNATLASIHSIVENRFIMDPSYPNGLSAGTTARTPMWIGLNASRIDGEVVQQWTDGTRWGQFNQLTSASAEGCGFIAPNLRWVVQESQEACDAERHFVCWKPPVGRVPDACACTEQTDAFHFGGYCGFWSGRNQASWCYVSPSCVTGVRVSAESELRRASCFAGEFASTTPMPTTTAAVTVPPIPCREWQYQRMVNGVAECADCNTWSSCNISIEFLDGTCSTYNNPVCSPLPDGMFVGDTNPPRLGFCDVRCQSCIDPSPNGCTSCMSGSPLFLEAFSGQPSGRCVADCQNRGKFKNNETQTCDICTASGGQQIRQRCGEYTDTQCEASSSDCVEGSGTIQGSGCCADCVGGVTFSASNVCQAVTACVSGEQEGTAPSTSVDRVCESCPMGTFSLDAGACTDLSTCPAGTHLQDGGDVASRPPHADRICAACGDGFYSTSPNQPSCVAVSPVGGCNPGSAQSAAPTPTSNRVCEACPTGQFNLGGGTGPCSVWTNCSAGQRIGAMPTPMADRVCLACNPGVTFSTDDNTPECLDALAACPVGYRQTAEPTVSSNRQCAPCAAGTFSDGSGTICAELRMCPPGTSTDMPTNLTDRNRNCTPCPLGQFSAEWNQAALPVGSTQCSTPIDCQPRQPPLRQSWGVVSDPTPTTDRVCEQCGLGQSADYASFSVNSQCIPVTLEPTSAPSNGGGGGGGNSGASSGGNDDAEANSMLLLVIVIVLIIVVAAVIGAVVVVKKAGAAAGGPNARVQSFDNPTYATGHSLDNSYNYDQNNNDPVYHDPDDSSGYLDVPGAGGIGGDEPGYMDVSPAQQFEDIDDSEDV